MTVFAIWLKAAADRAVGVVALTLGSLALVACGSPEPPPVSMPSLQPLPSEPQQVPRPPRPDLGLIPLPTVKEVQQSAPGGRADPFQPLSSERVEVEADDAVFDPASGLTLSGVLLVGQQRRALVQTQGRSGELCVGADGRCVADGDQLLPPGWSVLSIDVEQGCLALSREGEAQDLICLS